MQARTLLLDDSYFPIKIVSWQRAMILMLTGRAEMVVEYDDKIIRSVSMAYQLPKILKLYSRHKARKHVRFSRLNVFTRDRSTCQYCYKKFPMGDLTLDHVIPLSRGGDTNWENIVSACTKCNTKKGCKTPEEAGMRLMKKPIEPKWSPHLCLRLKEDDPQEWFEWFPQKVPGYF